jgi:RNA polymerase sigma factor (sigma-70 family)
MHEGDPRQRLRDVLEREAGMLHGILRHYVLRAGLAAYDTADAAARELLNEAVVEALANPQRLEQVREPAAWLIGIAANLIKRKREEHSRRNWREPLIRDLYAPPGHDLSDGELFDQVCQLAMADPAQELEAQERVDQMLAHVSESDQQVLRLAILHDLSGDRLAAELKTTPGAARVRLHRALSRLRAALTSANEVVGGHDEPIL